LIDAGETKDDSPPFVNALQAMRFADAGYGVNREIGRENTEQQMETLAEQHWEATESRRICVASSSTA
jgi:hypothetical protein